MLYLWEIARRYTKLSRILKDHREWLRTYCQKGKGNGPGNSDHDYCPTPQKVAKHFEKHKNDQFVLRFAVVVAFLFCLVAVHLLLLLLLLL